MTAVVICGFGNNGLKSGQSLRSRGLGPAAGSPCPATNSPWEAHASTSLGLFWDLL